MYIYKYISTVEIDVYKYTNIPNVVLDEYKGRSHINRRLLGGKQKAKESQKSPLPLAHGSRRGLAEFWGVLFGRVSYDQSSI